MKKIIFFNIIAVSFCLSENVMAQVGVNTPIPAATLDITAKNASGTSTGVDGLLIPRIDRQRAQSMADTPTSTLVYINSITTGTQTGAAVNIDATGYYYYNGTAWVKLNAGSGTNTSLYNTNGTLNGNRTVTQGTNTLAFNTSPTTGTSHFNVDGPTFNIDALNNRIGIGTNTPGAKLNVVDNSDNNQFNGIASFLANNRTAGVGIGWNGIQSIGSNTNLHLSLDSKGTGNILMQTQGTGNVGIGIEEPSNKLHINGTDPIRIEGTTTGDAGSDRLLAIDDNGVVKNLGTLGALSIPSPAIFRLETAQDDFLNGVSSGSSQVVPMTLIKNSISELEFNESNSTITFPGGTYQVMFVYEATHNNTGCTVSSYFVDFPFNNGSTRIHNTSSHSQGATSNHGNTVSYVTTINNTRSWQIRFGRGQSGNCNGPGMSLRPRSTQLLVFRIGD